MSASERDQRFGVGQQPIAKSDERPTPTGDKNVPKIPRQECLRYNCGSHRRANRAFARPHSTSLDGV
jgi:hypothetical protein